MIRMALAFYFIAAFIPPAIPPDQGWKTVSMSAPEEGATLELLNFLGLTEGYELTPMYGVFVIKPGAKKTYVAILRCCCLNLTMKPPLIHYFLFVEEGRLREVITREVSGDVVDSLRLNIAKE